MKAMIFAAGKGTRLKPLTENMPKALVKINGKPMLEHVITKLKDCGVQEIIINVHYLADQIIQFLKEKQNFGIKIEISDERDKLLNTGGGLKKAAWFFGKESLIVHNVDVISNINLKEMINFHKKNNALATLAVRKRITSRYFLFTGNKELCGWKNTQTNEEIITKTSETTSNFAFSGIHIINPMIFDYIKQEGTFSIVNSYLELSKTQTILGYEHNKDYWFDIGKPENLLEAENFIKSA